MAKIIGLPKLSPTMEEGTLLAWTKSEGDAVEVDDLLAEVETDKATMEFRSFDKGVLLKILVPAGETLAPDVPVAIIGDEGEDISALIAQVASGASQSKRDEAPAAEAPATEASKSEGAEAAAPATESKADDDQLPRSDRILASPLVRRMAREKDIDLSTVDGSGPRGRIIKRDMDALPADGAGRPATGGTSTHERRSPRVEKASSTRKTIARRLSESKQTVPHYYLNIDVDADALWAARKALNAQLAAQTPKGDKPEKVSINDLVVKACASALRAAPDTNASWQGDSIHYHQVVDISIAVAIPDGLITPVVRDADRKGVLEISREIRELAGKARDKKLRLEEITGGTFSISNLGMYGIESFAAVINPPEGAILAVGAVREEPVVRDGAVVAGRRMKVTLSADHRVIDGAVGATFLKALRGYLEQPLSMLL